MLYSIKNTALQTAITFLKPCIGEKMACTGTKKREAGEVGILSFQGKKYTGEIANTKTHYNRRDDKGNKQQPKVHTSF